MAGEYSNIITDLVTLRGNIRAAYEEDYQALDEKMQAVLQEIEKRTGTRIEIEYPKPAVLPFANDASLTRIAAAAGKKVFGEHFILEDENQLFLSGDNAYRYFQKSGDFSAYFSLGFQEKPIPFTIPNSRLTRRCCLIVWKLCTKSLREFPGKKRTDSAKRNQWGRQLWEYALARAPKIIPAICTPRFAVYENADKSISR